MSARRRRVGSWSERGGRVRGERVRGERVRGGRVRGERIRGEPHLRGCPALRGWHRELNRIGSVRAAPAVPEYAPMPPELAGAPIERMRRRG